MPKIFVIEDQSHEQWLEQFPTLDAAWAELRRLSAAGWDQQPNRAPCKGWRECGRDYSIVEFDTGTVPWRRVRRYEGLQVSAWGVVWGADAPQGRG